MDQNVLAVFGLLFVIVIDQRHRFAIVWHRFDAWAWDREYKPRIPTDPTIDELQLAISTPNKLDEIIRTRQAPRIRVGSEFERIAAALRVAANAGKFSTQEWVDALTKARKIARIETMRSYFQEEKRKFFDNGIFPSVIVTTGQKPKDRTWQE